MEVYQDVDGYSLAALEASPKYPATPDLRLHTTRLDMPDNIGSRFGTRLSGWIIPPVTGDYAFNVTGDDHVDASLALTSQPGDEARIAYHTGHTHPLSHNKYPTQTSAPVTLTAGKQYYFTVRAKENFGGDHLQLYWRTPLDASWQIVQGGALQSYSEGCRIEDCTDGIDNDGDGLVDECDPECPAVIGSVSVGQN